MGVYIKNMEMPKSCGYCPMLDDYGDYPVCNLTKEQRGYNFPVAVKRMDKCPLIPVPPHGRLIDADRFSTVLMNDEYQDAFHILAQTPTIIPAEEGE